MHFRNLIHKDIYQDGKLYNMKCQNSLYVKNVVVQM